MCLSITYLKLSFSIYSRFWTFLFEKKGKLKYIYIYFKLEIFIFLCLWFIQDVFNLFSWKNVVHKFWFSPIFIFYYNSLGNYIFIHLRLLWILSLSFLYQMIARNSPLLNLFYIIKYIFIIIAENKTIHNFSLISILYLLEILRR